MPAPDVALQFVLKIASRCNLNCSYCYVYNKGDDSWRNRPAVMSEDTFDAALSRIASHCRRSQQPSVRVTFHGGEPLLVGPERFDRWCSQIRTVLAHVPRVGIVIQTNGTLIDPAWVGLLREHRVEVGLSVDGLPDVHDKFRITHSGEGSYADVVRGAARLVDGGIPLHLLAVIQPGSDGARTHAHLLTLQPSSISYLLPDYTHDTVGPVRAAHGPTPCADFLIPAFDEWWFRGTIDLPVAPFWNIARLILGGDSDLDVLGNPLLRFLFVEADGAIEGLDVLRQCHSGVASTGLNVQTADFRDVADANGLLRRATFTGMPLPGGCRECPESETCAGGYLPHRYSAAGQFDNPSVWCADLLALFRHIRTRLGVGHDETRQRRLALRAAGSPQDGQPC